MSGFGHILRSYAYSKKGFIPVMIQPMILCDLGGTHARLGCLEGGNIHSLAKYKIATIQNHAALFHLYKKEYNLNISHLAIAASACHTHESYPSGFIENTKITQGFLNKHGYTLHAQLNDFEASAWGAAFYTGPTKVLHKGNNDLAPLECLIGPGTGLGCAFMDIHRPSPYIFASWPGGNMRPSFATQEQKDIISGLQNLSNTAIVYEDLASGRGIEKLYNLLCPDSPFPGVQVIIENPATDVYAKILRLFHEFLGLYIQNTAVTVGAGKITLHGGLLDYLVEQNCFDFHSLHNMVVQPYVTSLEKHLTDLPIHYIQDTYLALHGLKSYLQHKGEN